MKVLPDADGWGNNVEEMLHATGFQVTPDSGPVSAWTNWDESPVASFHL